MTEDEKDAEKAGKKTEKLKAKMSEGGTPSEGGSGLGDVETSVGGADAVPDTHG